MSTAKPMDLRDDQLMDAGLAVYGGRLDAYYRQNGHTRLTCKQNKRYWKKQRHLLAQQQVSVPSWARRDDGKGRPTPRQRVRRG